MLGLQDGGREQNAALLDAVNASGQAFLIHTGESSVSQNVSMHLLTWTCTAIASLTTTKLGQVCLDLDIVR